MEPVQTDTKLKIEKKSNSAVKINVRGSHVKVIQNCLCIFYIVMIVYLLFKNVSLIICTSPIVLWQLNKRV
jgi:hypothetical protein